MAGAGYRNRSAVKVSLWMSPQEQLLLESLDALLQSDAVRAGIDPIVERVQRKLAQDRAAAMAWEPIPLSIYGESLPAVIRSSWVFILQAWATTGAERHPNSHQRMMSFRGIGDLQTGDDGHWRSNLLISNREAALARGGLRYHQTSGIKQLSRIQIGWLSRSRPRRPKS